jgi:cyclitol reductase
MIPVGRRYRRLVHSDGVLRVEDASVLAPQGSAKAVLRPVLVGVCRSDLRELAGDRWQRRDFGHEMCAEVVGGSDDLADLLGRRVVYDPHPPLRRTSGFAELVELDGGLEQVSAALVPLPMDGIDPVSAVFAEPLSCAVHCVRRMIRASDELGLPADSDTAVYGAGMAGCLIAAVLMSQGVPVNILNRGESRIRFLRDSGFLPDEVVTAKERPSMYARAVLATSGLTSETELAASALLAPGGLMTLYSATSPGDTMAGIDVDSLRRKELSDNFRGPNGKVSVAGSYGASRSDFEAAIEVLQAPAFPGGGRTVGQSLGALVARVLSLTEAEIVLAKHAADGFTGKILIDPWCSTDRA